MDGCFTTVFIKQEINLGTPNATLLAALADKRYVVKRLFISFSGAVLEASDYVRLFDSLGNLFYQSGDNQFQPFFELTDLYLANGSAFSVASVLASATATIWGWAEVRG